MQNNCILLIMKEIITYSAAENPLYDIRTIIEAASNDRPAP